MRISWLSAADIATVRQALTAGGASYDDHFAPDFTAPPAPPDTSLLDWGAITEHVARAERVSKVVRESGLAAARARFAGSGIAIEAATLAAAAHEGDELALDEVIGVLECEIDGYVFYAPFLELMVALASSEVDRAVSAYEDFVAAYAGALSQVPGAAERVGAVRDGLADFYVSAGRLDQAEALFERRQSGAQEAGLRAAPRPRRSPHRALPLRLRNSQHALPQQPAFRRPQRLRPQRRHARPRGEPRLEELRAHRTGTSWQ
jgi:hypothetical protein